jgi:hypothetical protein
VLTAHSGGIISPPVDAVGSFYECPGRVARAVAAKAVQAFKINQLASISRGGVFPACEAIGEAAHRVGRHKEHRIEASMKSSEDPSQSEDTAAAAAPARLGSPARRRLLRGGMVAAPALLALKATPVMACNCKLPSGFSVSGNASGAQSQICSPPGCTPKTWQTQCNSSGCYTGSSCYRTDYFSKYFTCGTYTDKTLDYCLGYSNTDHRALATACYLQACSDGGAYFPTTNVIRDIWNMGVIAGAYPVPGSTAVWTKATCIAYLTYLTGQ